MKRVVVLFFLFFVIAASTVSVAAQTSSPAIPLTDGLLIPGLNCGVAGDTDPLKAKCCIQKKQDTSVMSTIGGVASALPVIGGYFKGINDNFNSLNSIQEKADPCLYGVPSTPSNVRDPNCICIQSPSGNAISTFGEFCTKYMSGSTNPNEKLKCLQCMETTGGFYTSVGCVPLDISTFITSYILTIGIGIAGGVALLCIMYSAFRMQTSMGNAEAIKKAQENLTACITGLIVIIFSVLILKIIGVDILRIPGLG